MISHTLLGKQFHDFHQAINLQWQNIFAAVTPLSTNNKYLESWVHICNTRGLVSLYTVVNVSELPSVIATEH